MCKNNRYISPYKKGCFFFNMNFPFDRNTAVLFHFRGARRLLLLNAVIFRQDFQISYTL